MPNDKIILVVTSQTATSTAVLFHYKHPYITHFDRHIIFNIIDVLSVKLLSILLSVNFVSIFSASNILLNILPMD